jgi:hypothetical protein
MLPGCLARPTVVPSPFCRFRSLCSVERGPGLKEPAGLVVALSRLLGQANHSAYWSIWRLARENLLGRASRRVLPNPGTTGETRSDNPVALYPELTDINRLARVSENSFGFGLSDRTLNLKPIDYTCLVTPRRLGRRWPDIDRPTARRRGN